MRKKPVIGFLPFYIKLYDDIGSGAKARPRLLAFYERIASDLELLGFRVIRTPFCRVSDEFSRAVHEYEAAGAVCILTWHAAYSPSLESIDAIAGTKLPVVVLDTTETVDFGPSQDPGEISYCHGIHGVMDMCNLLLRRGKKYAIAAGEYTPELLSRTADYIRAAICASALDGMRVGSIGGCFDGMGDFSVSDEEIKNRFGVTVVYPEDGELEKYKAEITDAEIRAETAFDREYYYEIEPVSPSVHERTVRNCLAVRKFISSRSLNAFTVNFREIRPAVGLSVMPFMEACKAMARGVGYAGEGDVLTAALCGAFLRAFPDTSFVEIFCPDWKGGRLLLSHMGEFNLNLTKSRPGMKEIEFIFGESENPVVGYGCYRGGKAVFVNLYRDAEGFKLLASDVTMENVIPKDDNFECKVRGWMKPHIPVGDFLEQLSRRGAIHHSVLIYGTNAEAVGYFASLCGLPFDVI